MQGLISRRFTWNCSTEAPASFKPSRNGFMSIAVSLFSMRMLPFIAITLIEVTLQRLQDGTFFIAICVISDKRKTKVADSTPPTEPKFMLGESYVTIRLRYIRLPNNTMEFVDELLYRSSKMIVGRSKVSSQNSVVFDGKKVLADGFTIVYFEFVGKWFNVVKIWNKRGEHTGYYCDIVTPPRFSGDWMELTDLFLDLWVSPDLRYKVLDEDEFEEAFQKGWITQELHEKARKELQKLIRRVENKRFPPAVVKDLERRLGL